MRPFKAKKITTVKINNLHFDTTVQELRNVFATFGHIQDIYIPRDPESGSARGFAYVRFKTELSAKKAIYTYNGVKFRGRRLKLRLPKKNTKPRKKRGARKEAPFPDLSAPPKAAPGEVISLRVCNLNFKTTADDLKAAFASCGQIADVYVPRNHVSGGNRGFGFVRFFDRNEAMGAIQTMYNQTLHGRRMIVKESFPKKPKAGGSQNEPQGEGHRCESNLRWVPIAN